MPEQGETEADQARLFDVAATRATQSLFITLSGNGSFVDRLSPATQASDIGHLSAV